MAKRGKNMTLDDLIRNAKTKTTLSDPGSEDQLRDSFYRGYLAGLIKAKEVVEYVKD